MGIWIDDLRRTIRRLTRRPAFLIAGSTTIGLGLGATVAMLGLVRGILLVPLEYADSEAVVQVSLTYPELGWNRGPISGPNFVDLRDGSPAFSALGAYQAGAVNYKVWENETKAGRIDPSKVRIIWRTPTYPDYNWSVRGDVDRVYGTGFTNRVKAALLAMKERSLLDAFPRRNFVPATNADYVVIENTAKSIGLIE